jgi:hypothetical protein
VQPSRLAIDLVQIQDPKVPGTPVRMVGLHATEAAEATLLPFFARAAGVSPPWFGEPHTVPRKSNIVQRLANTRSRAAGVSPPSFGNTLATAFRLSDRPVVVTGESRFRFCKRGSLTTAGSRQPLLVHDVRSLHKAPFAMHKRTFIRAAGVSPPGFGEPHVVPRESNIVRRLANTQPGAVGVSPPWFRFALTTVIVFCGVITFRTAHSLPAPRLADAPRSWCRANVCR